MKSLCIYTLSAILISFVCSSASAASAVDPDAGSEDAAHARRLSDERQNRLSRPMTPAALEQGEYRASDEKDPDPRTMMDSDLEEAAGAARGPKGAWEGMNQGRDMAGKMDQ